MTPRTFLAAITIAFAASLAAQQRCTSRTITERWLNAHAKHVDLAAQAAQMEQLGQRAGGLQTIPVVVHVVWNIPTENVSNTTIMNIIDQMNNDYQALNPDYGNVRTPFLASRGNAQISFCLATLDPNGNATSGIERFQTSQTWFDPDTQTDDMKQAPDGLPAWDPLKYLNVWICDISSGATGGYVTAGYAYLPYGGTAGTYIDGLVLDYSYGTGPGARTATHEVGHYLGLDHPWGNGNCSPGDGISDTPPTDSPTFSCSNHNLMKCGTLTQYENFMDYSNCTAMFTNGQASVMAGVLSGIRASLLSSTACQGGSSSTLCVPTSANGTADGDFIDGVQLGNIINLNSGSTTGPTYTDYTALSTTLERGATYTLQVTTGEYFEDTVAAWIDYNGSGTLEPSELLGSTSSISNSQVIPFTFTVPTNAILGPTVMRVRVDYPNTGEPQGPDPCADFSWGETEDYRVVINSPAGIAALVPGNLGVRTFPDHVLITWDERALPGAHITVLDAAGRLVMASAATGHEAAINTASIAPGVYQAVLIAGDSRRTARFMVAGR